MAKELDELLEAFDGVLESALLEEMSAEGEFKLYGGQREITSKLAVDIIVTTPAVAKQMLDDGHLEDVTVVSTIVDKAEHYQSVDQEEDLCEVLPQFKYINDEETKPLRVLTTSEKEKEDESVKKIKEAFFKDTGAQTVIIRLNDEQR